MMENERRKEFSPSYESYRQVCLPHSTATKIKPLENMENDAAG
jgi:hypothetical protein